VLTDLHSKNGTFLNGELIHGGASISIPDRGLIRAGNNIFVFIKAIGPMIIPPPARCFGLSGYFHVRGILDQIFLAAQTGRPILITGPSGCGKELAARALAESMYSGRVLAYNAAKFTSEEEAVTSLFGVGPRVFSGVEARRGLIETAHLQQQMFFLDEIHALPARVQQSLLRVIEDGVVVRIGETHGSRVHVRFVFATNKPGPMYGIEHDLVRRLKIISMPSLAARVADIPTIFMDVLREIRIKYKIDHSVLIPLYADHMEALCIDGCGDGNVRMLQQIAELICGRIRQGAHPEAAVAELFHQRFPLGAFQPNTGYKRDQITAPRYSVTPGEIQSIEEAHRKTGGNVLAIKKTLENIGLVYSRERLARILDQIGLPRLRRR
jgi:arginine utilization regulatory protein